MVAGDVWVVGRQRPNPEIDALRNEIRDLSSKIEVFQANMNTQRAELQGDIRELKAGTEKDISNLRWTFVVSLTVGAIILAIIARLSGII